MPTYKESSILVFIKKMKKPQSGGGIKSTINIFADKGFSILTEKAGFLSSVFSTLVVQLVVVALVAYYLGQSSDRLVKVKQWYIAYIVAMFVIIIVLVFVTMHPLLKFALFTVFSVLTGFTMALATSKVSKEVIHASIKGTLAIFVLFVLLGLVITISGINISWLGIALFFALLILVIVQIVFATIKDPSKKTQRIFAIIGLLLFSLYILYDTYNILQRDYFGDFVTAALDYFLDIINIFLDMISYMQN
jgi:FtsH-binding integral membrane protein